MCVEDFQKDNSGHFIHLLLEVNCSYGWFGEANCNIPDFCKKGVKRPGYHCLENDCPFRTFTYADNEICYAGELGEVPSDEHWIGFGGEMDSHDNDERSKKELVSLWETICIKKVQEAYEEFMKLKNSL